MRIDLTCLVHILSANSILVFNSNNKTIISLLSDPITNEKIGYNRVAKSFILKASDLRLIRLVCSLICICVLSFSFLHNDLVFLSFFSLVVV